MMVDNTCTVFDSPLRKYDNRRIKNLDRLLNIETTTNEGLKKNLELLSQAMDASISGITITDNEQPDNPIIYCNAAFERITGYNSDEILGKNCRFLQNNDRHQSGLKIIHDSIQSGESCKVELKNYKKDGSLFWNELYMSPIKDIENKTTHFIGVQNDISQRKQAELELKLDEIRKNDFIGMVSHELKTPLTSLKGYLELLIFKAEKNNDSFLANALVKANSKLDKMTQLINGFLNLSHLESGKIQLDLRRFNLKGLINEIIEELNFESLSNNVTFEENGSDISLYADRDKIGQVIINFLSNAVKYSSIGSQITIACKLEGTLATVSVRDNGIGIKAKDLEKIFERFYRVESKENKTISGFGIGLYLCTEIIHRHNGKIWAESEVHGGSTFNFTIPLS